jgi:hypothetical protein
VENAVGKTIPWVGSHPSWWWRCQTHASESNGVEETSSGGWSVNPTERCKQVNQKKTGIIRPKGDKAFRSVENKFGLQLTQGMHHGIEQNW